LILKEFQLIHENEGVLCDYFGFEDKRKTTQNNSLHQSKSIGHGLSIQELDEGVIGSKNDVLDRTCLNKKLFQQFLCEASLVVADDEVSDFESPRLEVIDAVLLSLYYFSSWKKGWTRELNMMRRIPNINWAR
jgi:hypothetical protein